MAAFLPVWQRLYADFLMPDRLDQYEALLNAVSDHGYQICGVSRFYGLALAGKLGPETRCLVLRHDVDSDPETARRLWSIESDRGVQSSYFFRLSTADISLMREIHRSASEVGYHYEELSTIAKEQGLSTRHEITASMEQIRSRFATNLARLRRETELPLSVAASHGDWVNRRLGILNTEILADRAFRAAMGIELEAYDAAYLRCLDLRIHDGYGPARWEPVDPLEAIQEGVRALELLVHPVHWRSNLRVNLARDGMRGYESLRYRWALLGRTWRRL